MEVETGGDTNNTWRITNTKVYVYNATNDTSK